MSKFNEEEMDGQISRRFKEALEHYEAPFDPQPDWERLRARLQPVAPWYKRWWLGLAGGAGMAPVVWWRPALATLTLAGLMAGLWFWLPGQPVANQTAEQVEARSKQADATEDRTVTPEPVPLVKGLPQNNEAETRVSSTDPQPNTPQVNDQKPITTKRNIASSSRNQPVKNRTSNGHYVPTHQAAPVNLPSPLPSPSVARQLASAKPVGEQLTSAVPTLTAQLLPTAQNDVAKPAPVDLIPASLGPRWRVGLNFAPYVGLAQQADERQSYGGMEAGLWVERRVAPRLYVGVGAMLLGYSFNLGGNSEPIATSFNNAQLFTVQTDNSAGYTKSQITGLNLPLVVRYALARSRHNELSVALGINNFTYLQEYYRTGVSRPLASNEVFRQNPLPGITVGTNSQVDNQVGHLFSVSEQRYPAFERWDLAAQAQLSLAYRRNLGRNWGLNVEPFARLPLRSTTHAGVFLHQFGLQVRLDASFH